MGITGTGYGIRTERSREISERLERSIPGGNTRSLAYFPPYPLVISSGSGCRIRDADGNEFIDLLNNYTASVHGHALPAVNEAMSEQAALGTVFPAPSGLQAELAERIVGRVASVEKVRFANSGTEAVMMAVRGARAFTGREKIVKAEGGYNGMWEQVPISWPQDPYRAAMPEGVRELVRMVDYNDVGQLEAAMERGRRRGGRDNPGAGDGDGGLRRDPEYFAAARRLADEHGALLICDEVITLRLGVGGFQEVLGVRPDLTTMGKIIGGGLPVGAFGGRAEVMESLRPPLSPPPPPLRNLQRQPHDHGRRLRRARPPYARGDRAHQRPWRAARRGAAPLFGREARSPRRREQLRVSVHVNLGTEGEVRKFSDLNLTAPWRQPSISRRSTRGLLRAARLHEHVNRDGRAGSRRSTRSLLLPALFKALDRSYPRPDV